LSWIEKAIVKPMDGNIQNSFIFIEYSTCSITNVDIPIEDANFLNFRKFFLSYSSSNSCIIKKAKAGYI
jgi:hypothetical protein